MSRKGKRIIAGGASVVVLLLALSLDYVRDSLERQMAALPTASLEENVPDPADATEREVSRSSVSRRTASTTLPKTLTTDAPLAAQTITLTPDTYVRTDEIIPILQSIVALLNTKTHTTRTTNTRDSEDTDFVLKQADAIYDSMNDSFSDVGDDLSELTTTVGNLSGDIASLTTSLTGLAFVEGGNAFGASAVLGTTDNQPLSLITNNTPRITITEDGKVGIGTTTPSQELSVEGNIRVEGQSTFSYIETSGNVAAFPVFSVAESHALIAKPSSDASLLGFAGFLSTVNTDASNTESILALQGGSFSVTHNGSGGTQSLVGLNVGVSNQGVGTTALEARGLTVSVQKSGSAFITNSYGLYIGNVQGTNTWGLYQNTATNRNYFAGAVNIGTTATNTPSKLTVVSTNVASTTLRLESPRAALVANNILGGIDFASNDTNLTDPGTTTASILARANETHTASALGTDLSFFTTNGTTTAERLRILGGGNVGIGTTTPSSKLTVAGTIQATNLLGGATNITTDASGNIIRDPSDERLKTNIHTIENALDTVLSLRGVSYEWKDTNRFGEQTEIGFIAQEVDLVLPEVVQKGGEYWSLNRSNMVAVVVEAVKEIYTRMETYFDKNDQEIERLKEQNDSLNARVNALEATLDIEDEEGGGNEGNEEPNGEELPVEPVLPVEPAPVVVPVEPEEPIEPVPTEEPISTSPAP